MNDKIEDMNDGMKDLTGIIGVENPMKSGTIGENTTNNFYLYTVK